MSASPDLWPQLPPSRLPTTTKAVALVRPASGDGLTETDGELLRLFTRHGDTAAFDRLVQRHTTMVWRVCRQTLRRQQDAEDAFQATFLLFVKGARQIGASESAAGWLFRVAYRTSLRARKRLASRREESLALDPAAPSEEQFPDLSGRQTIGVLAEELMELPLRYQTPLVMRYLEGQSRRDIAEATDVTVATVQGRLARGKQLLRRRLVHRGVSLAVAMGAFTGKPQAQAAAVPAPAQLLLQTTTNAAAVATGGSLAASAVVVTLIEQGTRAMLFASLTKPMAVAVACGVAALVLAAPTIEPTTTVSDGVVLSAAIEDEEAETPTATLELAADEPTNDREPEASAPGAEAEKKSAIVVREVYRFDKVVDALKEEDAIKSIHGHLESVAEEIADAVGIELDAIDIFDSNKSLVISADQSTHERIADYLEKVRTKESLPKFVAQLLSKDTLKPTEGESDASALPVEHRVDAAEEIAKLEAQLQQVNELTKYGFGQIEKANQLFLSQRNPVRALEQLDLPDPKPTPSWDEIEAMAKPSRLEAGLWEKGNKAIAEAAEELEALKQKAERLKVEFEKADSEFTQLEPLSSLVLGIDQMPDIPVADERNAEAAFRAFWMQQLAQSADRHIRKAVEHLPNPPKPSFSFGPPAVWDEIRRLQESLKQEPTGELDEATWNHLFAVAKQSNAPTKGGEPEAPAPGVAAQPAETPEDSLAQSKPPLEELVAEYTRIYERIKALSELGERGGDESRLAMAAHALARAKSRLAESRGEQEEAAARLKEAVAIAEREVAAAQAAYEANRVVLSEVFEALERRAEDKAALAALRGKPARASHAAAEQPSTITFRAERVRVSTQPEPTTVEYYLDDLLTGADKTDPAALRRTADELGRGLGIDPALIRVNDRNRSMVIVATPEQHRQLTAQIEFREAASSATAAGGEYARVKERMPAPILGYADNLEVTIWSDNPEHAFSSGGNIDETGGFVFGGPYGEIEGIAGKTLDEAQAIIADHVRKQLGDPSVQVRIGHPDFGFAWGAAADSKPRTAKPTPPQPAEAKEAIEGSEKLSPPAEPIDQIADDLDESLRLFSESVIAANRILNVSKSVDPSMAESLHDAAAKSLGDAKTYRRMAAERLTNFVGEAALKDQKALRTAEAYSRGFEETKRLLEGVVAAYNQRNEEPPAAPTPPQSQKPPAPPAAPAQPAAPAAPDPLLDWKTMTIESLMNPAGFGLSREDAQWYLEEMLPIEGEMRPNRDDSLRATIKINKDADAAAVWEAWQHRNPEEKEREVRVIAAILRSRDAAAKETKRPRPAAPTTPPSATLQPSSTEPQREGEPRASATGGQAANAPATAELRALTLTARQPATADAAEVEALRQQNEALRQELAALRRQPLPVVTEAVAAQPLLPLEFGSQSGSYAAANERYGYSVQQLQRRLNEVLNPAVALEADGDYGPKTAAAVKAYQMKHGLQPTDFADEETRVALGLVESPPRFAPPRSILPQPNLWNRDDASLPSRRVLEPVPRMAAPNAPAPPAPTPAPPKPDERADALRTRIEKNLEEAEAALTTLIDVAKKAEELRRSAAEPGNTRITVVTRRAIESVAQTQFEEVRRRINGVNSLQYNYAQDIVLEDPALPTPESPGLVASLTQLDAAMQRAVQIQQLAEAALLSVKDKEKAKEQFSFDIETFDPQVMRPEAATPATEAPPAKDDGAKSSQYGPEATMKQGQWRVFHEPSELDPAGWCVIAEVRDGEHLPVLLPGDERPRPHLRREGEHGNWKFRVVDPGHEYDGKLIPGGGWAGEVAEVRGMRINVSTLSFAPRNDIALVLIRGVQGRNAAGLAESLPNHRVARRLLHEAPQSSDSKTPPAEVTHPTATRSPGRVDYSDGKADGKKSLGGSGHLLRFELPDGALGVKGVRIHGSRYGTAEAPNEDFEIAFLSEDRSEILAVEHAPYGLFRRGPEAWTTVKFDKPVVDLPEKFWVAINFNPGRTKGVYFSYDTSTGGERSMAGTSQQQPDQHKAVDFGGDWMASIVLERE